MLPDLSIQLYTLRHELEADYRGTLQALAEMGLACIEPAGLHGCRPAEAKLIWDELGLRAPTGGSTLPIGEDKNKLIETALLLGHQILMTGVSPGVREDFASADTVKAMAELYAQAAENLAPHGLQVAYHNHDWDLVELDGTPAYRIFLDNTPESVLWEADTYWVAKAGYDPAAFIKEIGPRGKVLHFKDGRYQHAPTDDTPPFLPAGSGEVDLIAASQAAEHAQYIAIELDAYNGEMLEAVQKSYTYLTKEGIAQGKA